MGVIKSIFIYDEGLIHLTYTHDDDETQNLKWLSGLDISEDGKITLHFAHGKDKTLEEPVVKWIDSVIIDTGEIEGTGDQKFEITYNTGEKEKIGNPINYFMGLNVTDDYHLIVKHSDPEKRKAVQDAGENYKGPDGTGYKEDLEWQDLGSVKDESGILVGLNLTEKELGDKINSIEETIQYLNDTYPNGLKGRDGTRGDDLTGKIVTVGLDEHGKLFYGFDYSLLNDKYKGWYYLGTLQLDIGHIITVGEETESEKYEKLEPDGVWFRVEDKIISEEG